MGISKFKDRKSKVTWVLALLLTLQSLFISANARMATGVATDLNLSSEERELARFSDDLFTFNQQVLSLSKKSRLTNSELASARSSGNGLKQRISSAQQNFRSIIAKLKAANQWDTLDAQLAALITDSGIRSILQAEGGAKKILDDLANHLTSLSQEIDGSVQSLSGRVQSQSSFSESELPSRAVRVAYQPTAVFGKSLGCRLAIAGVTIKTLVGHRPPTSAEGQKMREACGNATTSTT
jgi:hypothetical protein